MPRDLNPAGKLARVPASSNCLNAEVAVRDNPPIICINPKP